MKDKHRHEAAAALYLWEGSSSEDIVSLVREAWGTSWTSFFLSLCSSSWDSCSENAWLHALQEEKGILLTDSGAVTVLLGVCYLKPWPL